jgi:hypothetical protein
MHVSFHSQGPDHEQPFSPCPMCLEYNGLQGAGARIDEVWQEMRAIREEMSQQVIFYLKMSILDVDLVHCMQQHYFLLPAISNMLRK